MGLGDFGRISILPDTCSVDRYPQGRCENCPVVEAAGPVFLGGLGIPIIVAFVVIFYAMARIVWTVRQQERRQIAYQFRASTTTHNASHSTRRFSLRNSTNSTKNDNTNSKVRIKRYQRSKESAKQAGLFLFAYAITYTPVLVSMILSSGVVSGNPHGKYRLDVLGAVLCTFTPLQGLWNLISKIPVTY